MATLRTDETPCSRPLNPPYPVPLRHPDRLRGYQGPHCQRRSTTMNWITVNEAEATGKQAYEFIFSKWVDSIPPGWQSSTTRCDWPVVREQKWTHACLIEYP